MNIIKWETNIIKLPIISIKLFSTALEGVSLIS